MKHKLYVALDNIRSAENVGSILRTSDAFGIDKVYLCGITASIKNRKVLKTSLGAEKSVKTKHQKELATLLKRLKEKGFEIVSLEQTEKSKDIAKFRSEKDTCLIIGNEVSGVSKEVLDLSDQHIHIPMQGKKESLNVSVAYGIAVYRLRSIK